MENLNFHSTAKLNSREICSNTWITKFNSEKIQKFLTIKYVPRASSYIPKQFFVLNLDRWVTTVSHNTFIIFGFPIILFNLRSPIMSYFWRYIFSHISTYFSSYLLFFCLFIYLWHTAWIVSQHSNCNFICNFITN